MNCDNAEVTALLIFYKLLSDMRNNHIRLERVRVDDCFSDEACNQSGPAHERKRMNQPDGSGDLSAAVSRRRFGRHLNRSAYMTVTGYRQPSQVDHDR
jgi:hypothetical protein